jgi:branched-chain amino acid transport system substrate-binding protein
MRSVEFSRSVSRRRFLAATSAIGALGLYAPATLGQINKPIRLGVLNSFTGDAGYSGQNALRGMQLFFDSVKWTIAGRKVELIAEDDQFNPQIGLQKARKLLESDHVDLILGPQSSGVAHALLNYMRQHKGFLVITGAGADELAFDRYPYPYFFRSSWSGAQLIAPTANWAYDNVAKTATIAAADYVGGHDNAKDFRTPFEARGGKIAQEFFPPLGTTDFSAYLTTIRSLNVAASWNFFPGLEALRFIRQYDAAGLKEKTTFLGYALIDSATLPALGRAALGLTMCTLYARSLQNPENKQFVRDYRAKYQTSPDLYSDMGFVGAHVVNDALAAVDGDAYNKDKLAAAMMKVSFKAPRGPFRFDPLTHSPIQNTYITRVEDVNGQPDEIVIATISDTKAPLAKTN